MRFAVVLFASLIAGAFAASVELSTPWHAALKEVIHDKLPKEVKALNIDPITLPDIEFTVGESKVYLTGGKATGLSKVMRPRGHCLADGHDVKCHFTFDGLHVSYEAMSTNPEKKFPVEVHVQNSVVEVVLKKNAPRYELKDGRLLNFFLYVREADFSDVPQKTVTFDNELKLKVHSALVEALVQNGLVKKVFAKALSEVNFPEA